MARAHAERCAGGGRTQRQQQSVARLGGGTHPGWAPGRGGQHRADAESALRGTVWATAGARWAVPRGLRLSATRALHAALDVKPDLAAHRPELARSRPAVGGSVPTSVAEGLGVAVLTYLPVLWGGWCWRSGAAAGSVQWSPAGARLGGRTTRRRLRAGARSFGRAKGSQRKCLRLWGCDSGHETVLVGDAAGELGVPDRCLVRTSTQIALGWVHRARGGVGAAGGTCPDVGDTVGCG